MKNNRLQVCFHQTWGSITSLIPPLGLGHLASSAEREGFRSVFIEPNFSVMPAGDAAREIVRIKPDVLAVSIMTTFFNKSRELISLVKKLSPDIKVIIGGPHVTALGEYSLAAMDADFAIIGEGEVTFVELLKAIESGRAEFSKIDGLLFKDAGTIRTNRSRELIKDINSLPFPAWDKMMLDKYPPTPHGAFFKRFPFAPMITTRGCAFDCDFCASTNTWKRRLRHRDPRLVVDEIEYLMKNFGIREIFFEDDNIISPPSHIIGICEEIMRRNIDITWTCPAGVRADQLNGDILKTMRRAGCYLVALGIESGNQGILNGINKKLDLAKVPQVLRSIKSAGLISSGFFIFGLPGETPETANDTVNFALNNCFDQAHFGNLLPLPGSKIFKDWLGSRCLDSIDWDKFDVKQNTFWRTDAMTNKEIAMFRKNAARLFYRRPKTFISVILRMKPRQILYMIKRIIRGEL